MVLGKEESVEMKIREKTGKKMKSTHEVQYLVTRNSRENIENNG